MTKPRAHMTLPETVLSEIDARGDNRSGVVERDLTRLYTLYRFALRDVQLTPEEAALICDALNGFLPDPHSADFLWAQIEDAIVMEGLDKKWGVDKALVQKLKNLDRFSCMAIMDAAERFWQETPQGDAREEVRRFFLIR